MPAKPLVMAYHRRFGHYRTVNKKSAV